MAQSRGDSLAAIIRSTPANQKQLTAYISFAELLATKNFEECIDIANRGIKLAATLKDSTGIARLQHYEGNAYYFKGSYDTAALLFYAAINMLEKKNEQSYLAYTYNDLAKLYRKKRDLKRASEKYETALQIFRSLKDSTGISTILNESGVVYEYAGNYDEALRRYNGSLEICDLRNDSVGISYALSNIAGVDIILKNYSEAEKNLLQTLSIRQRLNDSFALALTYSDLGSLYAGEGNYARAIESITSSNNIAAQIKYLELQSTNYNELSEIEKKQGHFQLAFQYYQKHVSLRDSIFKLESAKQIEALSAHYENSKKEEQIKLQGYQIQRRNILLTLAGILILIIVVVSYLVTSKNKLTHQARLQKEIISQQNISAKAVIEAEENERKRIAGDLHDGVGQIMSATKMNLSAMENDLVFKDDEQKINFEKIISLVDESCSEIRTISHQMMPNALLRSGLSDAIKEFIEKINGRVLKVTLHSQGLDQSLDPVVETVLYRVIQECVNNVIKHAQATKLDIAIFKDTDGIAATIEDNGTGFDTQQKENTAGIGLKNIKTRIAYLKGTVDYDSEPGKGTLVAIHVPVNE